MTAAGYRVIERRLGRCMHILSLYNQPTSRYICKVQYSLDSDWVSLLLVLRR